MTTLSKSAIPRNFSWLEQSKLAGCARPSESELEALKELGIKAIISLTETPLNHETVSRLGFDYLHSPVPDYTAPLPSQLHDIIQFVEEKNAQSKPVLVHCGEGKRRTGTILAAYLVYHGETADESIKRVRKKRPGSIENSEQKNAIRSFEKDLRSRESVA